MLSGVEIVGEYTDSANVPPVAQIGSNAVSGSAPLTVAFSAADSYDPDGQIADYIWDFGDGGMVRGPNASHVFTEQGSYTVVLMVLDNRGAAGTASVTVNVSAGSPAAFVCSIRASGGDYTSLSSWNAAIASDLTSSGSKLFNVTNRGSYSAGADDGMTVTFSGGGTGTLKHINGDNVAYVVDCAGTINSGTVSIAGGHTFSVSGPGSPIYTAVAEGYNDWPAAGLADNLTLAGWVTDANHSVAIRPAAGEGHNGVITDASGNYTGFAIYGGSATDSAILDQADNLRISGIIVAGGRLMLGDHASVSRVWISGPRCSGKVPVEVKV